MTRTQRFTRAWRAIWLALAAVVTTVGLGVLGGPASAAQPQSCSSSAEGPYSVDVRALTGGGSTEIRLQVTAADGCPPVTSLKKLQLKIHKEDDGVADVQNLHDVAAPDGIAVLELPTIDRGRLVEADVQVVAGRTYGGHGDALVRLKPDLVVATIDAPLQTLITRPIDVLAEIAESGGDTAATATVDLSWGPTVLATTTITVPAGGSVTVPFSAVALTEPVPVELSVRITGVDPGEADAANNARTRTVDVTEHELARARLLVDVLGGYGAQFNQHVFAAITPAPPGSLPDLEAKAKALEPQLVRIFFHEIQERDPDKMASFVRTVELAHEAGATINITYQTATNARFDPPRFMAQFATILEDLVRARGFTNVRWVTIQNEPNTTNVTLAQYNALYRALNAELEARGLRDHIGLMGGDLLESGGGGHRVWLQYMAENMNDVIDAYSEHIYWNYWDLPRAVFRLRDVRLAVSELDPDAQKPVFVTEFGVRGIQNFPGKPVLQPGYWEDGTPIGRTNIAAFQQLWFNLASAQLGFSGTAKWDAYWGKYDSGTQSHWLIGPAEEGWPLFPAYHAIRLLLQTTHRGWQVLGVDPWADDDWKVGEADGPEKEITAYAGPNGELTLMGVDTHGGGLNAASADAADYSVGGLPPGQTFNLAVWNRSANGVNEIVGTVAASAAGVARFQVPVHAIFALTTVAVS